MAFEQAEKLGLLERMHEVFSELIQVNSELGNIWSVTPGSQILLTTAFNNVVHGRYERPSDDLKRLLLVVTVRFPSMNPRNGSTRRSWSTIGRTGKSGIRSWRMRQEFSSSRMRIWKQNENWKPS